MPEQSLDSRGRVTIQPQLRARLGKRFVQILMPDGIHLVPITGKIDWNGPPMSVEEQERVLAEEMDKEIDEELRTIHGVTRDGKRIRGWKRDGKRRRQSPRSLRKSH